MKETTSDLICLSIGCVIGSLTYGYFYANSSQLVFNTIVDTLFGIWVSYIMIRIKNKNIQ